MTGEPGIVSGELKNGLRVIVRPLRRDDRQLLAEGFQLLSEQSRYERFLTGRPTLSEADLRVLVDRVDHHDHEALAMVWPRHSQPDVLVGVGRFIRLKSDPTTADVAVTMADELHGQGGGTLMIGVLAERARQEGVTRFTACILPGNEASRRMLSRVGRVVRDVIDSGVRELDVDL